MAMSDEHKAALARGRREAVAIKRYLEALEKRRPGRPITLASLAGRLDQVNRRIGEETDPLRRVDLMQARIDIEQRIASFEEIDFAALEDAFVECAAEYSDRKGITYSAWREIGVSAAVLKQAGIPRTRRS
jgi:hypothetical protein